MSVEYDCKAAISLQHILNGHSMEHLDYKNIKGFINS